MEPLTILITGATNGIGKVSARELAKMGHHIVVVSRDAAKCETTAREIGNQAEFIVADLSTQKGVEHCAVKFRKQHKKLNVLLNNVGAIFMERLYNDTGWEMTMALNHFSYFYLTHLLWPSLVNAAKENGEARVINISSDAHRAARKGINLSDIDLKQSGYAGWERYGESKLANLYFTYMLDRLKPEKEITVNALHPGFVDTGFGDNNQGALASIFNIIKKIFARDEMCGAATSIYLAESAEVKGISGKYYKDKKIAHSNSLSHDQKAQEYLWQISMERFHLINYFG